MKVETRNQLFGQDLSDILSGNVKKTPEVSQSDFAPNLYKIKRIDQRDLRILEYIKKLSTHADLYDSAYKTCKQLVDRLATQATKHKSTPKKIHQEINKTKKLFNIEIPPFGKYPGGDSSLPNFQKQLEDESSLIAKFKKCQKDTRKHDPELVKKIAKAKAQMLPGHRTFAYTDNQIAQLNASHFQIGNKVNFILSASPRSNTEIANHLYHAMIASDCNVWFTLNECKDRPKFWDESYLKSLKLPKNWKITTREKTIVDEKSSKKSAPRITKSVLIADNGQTSKKITHYHYENWIDHEPAPCEKMLLKCAKIACESLQKTGQPVGINCKGGRGRTGVLANIIYGMRHIDQELSNGKKSNKIFINPTELNYDLRRNRSGLISTPAQFVQTCRVLDNYIKKI